MYRNEFEETPDNINELLQRYENYLIGQESNGLDEEDFEVIINYYDDAEDIKKALEVAENASKALPYAVLLKLKKADLLIAVNRYNQALRALDEAEVLDSLDYNIVLLRMDAYYGLNKQKTALEVFNNALPKFIGEDKVELLLEASEIFDEQEDFDGVFDCLKFTLQEDPNNEEALHKICYWTEYTFRYEESLIIHQEITEKYPYNELAWFNIGCCYQGLKFYEKAIDAYSFATAIDDDFTFAHRNIADAYMRLRKYQDALNCLLLVNTQTNNEVEILAAIAYCYQKLNDFNNARKFCKQALLINPQDTELLYKIGCTYMGQNNWSSALKYLNQAITFYSQKATYYNAIGQCNFSLGNYGLAIDNFAEAVRLKPKWKIAWKDFLTAYYEIDEFEMCITLIKLAQLQFAKPEISFEFLRVACLYLTGDIKESISLLETILPNNQKHLSKLLKICPEILENNSILHIINSHVKQKRIKNKQSKKNNNRDDNFDRPF